MTSPTDTEKLLDDAAHWAEIFALNREDGAGAIMASMAAKVRELEAERDDAIRESMDHHTDWMAADARVRELQTDLSRRQPPLEGEARSRLLAAIGAEHVDAAIEKVRELQAQIDRMRVDNPYWSTQLRRANEHADAAEAKVAALKEELCRKDGALSCAHVAKKQLEHAHKAFIAANQPAKGE